MPIPATRGAAAHRDASSTSARASSRTRGAREQALTLYEQATALRGDAGGAWTARVPALRKALSVEYYERGMRAYRTDLAQAMALFEASVRFDPANAQAAAKLKEAQDAKAKLDRIDRETRKPQAQR